MKNQTSVSCLGKAVRVVPKYVWYLIAVSIVVLILDLYGCANDPKLPECASKQYSYNKEFVCVPKPPVRYLSEDEDKQMKEACEPDGCVVVPKPVFKQFIEQLEQKQRGQGVRE